jgi:phosphatidate cytidylyltransferase
VPEPGKGTAGAAQDQGPAKPTAWSLRLRIASAVLFVPLLALLARAGGLAFLGFAMLQATLGLHEFYGMMRAKGHRPNAPLGFAAVLAVCALAFRPTTPHAAFLATAALLLLLADALRHPERTGIVESMAVTVFGVLYVGWLSAHFVLLRELPWRAGLGYPDGARLVLFAFLVTWSCDSGAFLVGRWLGRTRPWGSISPRKSLEGSAGGFVFALAASLLGARTFMHGPSGAAWLSIPDALAIGVVVGLCGQVGDLVESLLKRDARSGDSSDLIPGHGGVLDRFDSVYFGAPLVYYYLRVVVFQVP